MCVSILLITNMTLKYIFILMILFFVSCKPKSTDTGSSNQLADSLTISKDNEQEDFNEFYKKFTADSTFQMERTKFPFRVLWISDDGETTHETQREDWTHSTFYYDDSYATRPVDAYKQEVKLYADSAKVEQRGVDNGIYVDYLFKRDKGKWILFTGRDYSN
jgi:hypothetical protein